jgi:hypothetical protein
MHLLLSALLTLSLQAPAAAEVDLVAGGLDPVELCAGHERPGLAQWEVQHGRFRYRFADEANRARFAAAPEDFAAQWGGACGRMGPLSGLGSGDRYTVHEGRIYLFASDGCRSGFLGAVERFVPPPVEPDPASPEQLAAGQEWLGRALAAHGGAPAIDALSAVEFRSAAVDRGWSHVQELTLHADGRSVSRDLWTPDDPQSRGFEASWHLGPESYLVEQGERFPVLDRDQRIDLRRRALREPLALFWARGDAGFRAVDRGAGTLDGQTVQNLELTSDGLLTTAHLDPASGRVLGITWRGRRGDGVTREHLERFGGWREVQGVTLPGERTIRSDGAPEGGVREAWDRVEPASR